MTTLSGNAGQQLDFQVLRPAGGSLYTVVGHTGAVTLVGTGGTETFSAHIAAQTGDVLGVYDVTAVLTGDLDRAAVIPEFEDVP